VERRPDGEIRFALPNGDLLPAVPAPAAIPDDPAGTIRTGNEAQGLHIHPRTAIPTWPGDRLDLGYAIDVLRPRRNTA